MDYKREYNENGFTIMDNFLPVENYNKMIKIYNSSKFIEIHTIRKNRYKRWETLEDKRFPSTDEIYEANYWSSNEIVNNEYYKSIFEEVTKQKKGSLLETQKLAKNQIKCPYCRNIQKGILPYNSEFPKVKNVNWPPSKAYHGPNNCHYKIKSGKRKS